MKTRPIPFSSPMVRAILAGRDSGGVWYRAGVPEYIAGRATGNFVPYDARQGVAVQLDVLWRPSIFMPRWASRITLEITDVRAERLQNITEADAQAEGLARPILSPDTIPDVPPPFNRVHPMTGYYRDAFRELWHKLNGKKHPWSSSPFVWVVSFRRVTEVTQSQGGDE